jgi:DNA (cytosine-5)-methyltransferase 1
MAGAYYNEIEPYCAKWLRNLIAAGHIAPGDVDERSITEVQPDDLKGYTQCHFFAGIGIWSLALRMAGWPDGRPVWTGSCPCQPFSVAGKQAGFDDARHLWPVWQRLIAKRRPAVVFGEQVAAAAQWLGLVRGDLEAMDYAVGCQAIQAASAGADHLRDRYWFVASGVAQGDAYDTGSQGRPLSAEGAGERPAGQNGMAHTDLARGLQSEGLERDIGRRTRDGGQGHGHLADPNSGSSGARPGDAGEVRGISEAQCEPEHGAAVSGRSGDEYGWVIGADGKARRVKPGIRLLVNGHPNRVAKLRAFGNAIDPRPASEWIGAYLDQESVAA